MSHKVRLLFTSITVMVSVLAISILMTAQTPTKPVLRFTATTENVGSAGQNVRIELFAWSTDVERDQFAKAWTSPEQPVQPAVAADAGGGGRGGRGGGRGGRGGRGGGGRGGDAAPLPVIPVTPTSSLAAALKKAPSVGMLWTSETVGYAIRYAYRFAQPDGGERIILATDRRLGAWNAFWKPVGTAPPTDYPFSVIELRLSASGLGEGKVSFVAPITVDDRSKSITMENYESQPVILKGVKRQSGK